jgi:hypothetical protein
MLAAEEGRKEIYSTSIRNKHRRAVDGLFSVGCSLGHGGHLGERETEEPSGALSRPHRLDPVSAGLSLWRAE